MEFSIKGPDPPTPLNGKETWSKNAWPKIDFKANMFFQFF